MFHSHAARSMVIPTLLSRAARAIELHNQNHDEKGRFAESESPTAGKMRQLKELMGDAFKTDADPRYVENLQMHREHIEDLSLIPANAIKRTTREGVSMIVFSGSAADAIPSIANERPRGWTEGKTWKDVGGIYDPASKTAIAGSVFGGHRSGAASDHSTAIHEYGHAMGDVLGYDNHPDLIAAHIRLYGKLEPYLQQNGPGGFAGRQEMFAEGCVTYLKQGAEGCSKRFDPQFASFMTNVFFPVKS